MSFPPAAPINSPFLLGINGERRVCFRGANGKNSSQFPAISVPNFMFSMVHNVARNGTELDGIRANYGH
jgi:hypothetical protein